MGKVKDITLIDGAIATGAQASVSPLGTRRTFHATGFTSAGAGAATIGVEVSNDGTNFVEIDELSLTLGTTIVAASQDVFAHDAAYKFVRGNVKTISGTDAEVTLTMGVQL